MYKQTEIVKRFFSIHVNIFFIYPGIRKVFVFSMMTYLNKPFNCFCSTELFNLAPLLLILILFGIVYIYRVSRNFSSNHTSLSAHWPLIGGSRDKHADQFSIIIKVPESKEPPGTNPDVIYDQPT